MYRVPSSQHINVIIDGDFVMTMTDTEIDDGVDAGDGDGEGAGTRSAIDAPGESEEVTPASRPHGGIRKATRAARATKGAKAKGGKAKSPKVAKATKAMPRPTLSTPISPAPSHLALYSAAQVARLVGDPTRLRILCELDGGEKDVGMIVRAVQMGQPAVSHHLTLLKLSGLVTPTRAGKHNIYTLTPSGKMAWEFAKELIERSVS
jgi:DNA-binding transcriptional ArsR family regulator